MLFKGIHWLLLLLQLCIGTTGFLLSAFILGESLDVGLQPFSSLFMAFMLSVVGIFVHEGGHYLGARWCGMTVLSARVMMVEAQPLQRGWRLRWARQPKGAPASGSVMAVHLPHRPMRRSMLVFTLMGPGFNLLGAGLCFALHPFLAGKFAALVLALGVCNLALGLLNLVPTAASGRASDGAVLLAWLCKPDEGSEVLANARLLALTIAGTQAENLPDADLQQLAAQPLPVSLGALGYHLLARQNQADWPGAVAIGAELQTLLATHPQALQRSSVALLMLRAELAFSQAMLERDASQLHAYFFTEELDWYIPTLRPRCLALRAALAGDAMQMAQAAQQAQQLAGNSRDRSQAPREQRLAGYIAAMLMAPAGSDPAPKAVATAAPVGPCSMLSPSGRGSPPPVSPSTPSPG